MLSMVLWRITGLTILFISANSHYNKLIIMKFKVQVEEFVFYINVGQGLNDFAWFALAAAKLYSNKKNPDSNYLPCYL